MSVLGGMQGFDTQQACLQEIARYRWLDRVTCTCCDRDLVYRPTSAATCLCARCRHPLLVTKSMVSHRIRVPLAKWVTTNLYKSNSS